MGEKTLTVSDAVQRFKVQAEYHKEEAARLYRAAEGEPSLNMKKHLREAARDQDVSAQTIERMIATVGEIGRIG